MPRRARSPSLIAFATIALLVSSTGCTRSLAERAVRAQNVDAKPHPFYAPCTVLVDQGGVQVLNVDVGPPSARLSVWVADPAEGHYLLELVQQRDDRMELRLRDAPTTRPLVAALPVSGAEGTPAPERVSPSSSQPFGEDPRATIVLLHGIGDNKALIPYQFWAAMLRNRGYRVVLVDLRGHGQSTGDRITYGALESRDLVQLLDELARQDLVAGEVGVLGGSYGGAVALQWAAIDSRVRAVVTLAPFSSLRAAAHDTAPAILGVWRWLYPRRRIDRTVRLAGQLGGFDPATVAPVRAIRQTTQPVLLIHGRDDTFVTPAHSRRLHDAAPDRSRLVLVDGAGHADLWLTGYETIYRETIRWFETHLRDPSTRPAGASTSKPSTPPTLIPLTRPSEPRSLPSDN